MRVTSQPKAQALAEAMSSAASGAGTALTDFGIRSQRASTPIVSRPTAILWPCSSASWWGSSIRLASAERCGLPPSTMCSWDRAMTTPTPASMPWTTAGETASAALAARNTPSSSCTAPASRVIMQVARQPYVSTRSATTRDSPAAGPLT
jgi:hypothetical protein